MKSYKKLPTAREKAIAALALRQRKNSSSADGGDRPSHLSRIPKDWPDFARITKIRSGTKMIPFDPYDYQVRISNMIDRTRGVVIVKPRQHGLTEMVANKFLHKACLYPTYFAAVFSKGQDDTANIARRVRMMAASAQIPLSSNNVKDIQVDGGGRIVFRTASPDSGRGLESVWDLLFDECAFVNVIDQIFAAATPSQSLPEQQGKAKTIFLSTPNTKGGLYYDTLMAGNGDRNPLVVCEQLRNGEIEPYQEWVDLNGWGKCFIHWRGHPIHGLTPNYLEQVKERQRITEAQLQREYNLSFDDSSGGVLFNEDAIIACSCGQWEGPKVDSVYLFGIDPNFGGGDFFRCQVWDVTDHPAKLVAEYGDSQKSTEYSISKVCELIDEYYPKLVAVESNSGGKIIFERLVRERQWIRFEQVNTSHGSKIVNTDRIAIAIEQREVIYPPDWDGIREMRHFTLRERCANDGHDDAVMAWAAAWAWRSEVKGPSAISVEGVGRRSGLSAVDGY
jgi:hypothetical protein